MLLYEAFEEGPVREGGPGSEAVFGGKGSGAAAGFGAQFRACGKPGAGGVGVQKAQAVKDGHMKVMVGMGQVHGERLKVLNPRNFGAPKGKPVGQRRGQGFGHVLPKGRIAAFADIVQTDEVAEVIHLPRGCGVERGTGPVVRAGKNRRQ